MPGIRILPRLNGGRGDAVVDRFQLIRCIHIRLCLRTREELVFFGNTSAVGEIEVKGDKRLQGSILRFIQPVAVRFEVVARSVTEETEPGTDTGRKNMPQNKLEQAQ